MLDDPAPFVPFFLTKRKKEIDYEAKAVTLARRRYIVCRSHDRMTKDAAEGAKILAVLEEQTETEVEQDGKRFVLRSPPRRDPGAARRRRRPAADRASGPPAA